MAGVLTMNRSQVAPSPPCTTGLGFVSWEWQCAKDMGKYLFHSCHLTNEENWGPQQENNSQLLTEEPDEIPARSEQVEKLHKAWNDCPSDPSAARFWMLHLD